jgi:hypothetical protein
LALSFLEGIGLNIKGIEGRCLFTELVGLRYIIFNELLSGLAPGIIVSNVWRLFTHIDILLERRDPGVEINFLLS